MVEKGLASADSVNDTDQVAPFAFIRFSRGGKTRALYELAKSLRHASPDVAVVYVSFNDYSGVRDWERENPVCALCCRIAFAALFSAESAAEPNKDLYDRFANTSVTADDVRNWLGDKPCLLLIDEVNVGNEKGICTRIGRVSQDKLFDHEWSFFRFFVPPVATAGYGAGSLHGSCWRGC